MWEIYISTFITLMEVGSAHRCLSPLQLLVETNRIMQESPGQNPNWLMFSILRFIIYDKVYLLLYIQNFKW